MKKYNNSNQLISNRIFNKVLLLGLIPLTLLSIIGFSGYTEAKTNSNKAKETITSNIQVIPSEAILPKLIEYTNAKSAGPTENYYWENGTAKLSNFDTLKAGEYKFEADDKGRSSTARAILTYSQYESSKGSRQGQPLEPPFWPKNNPKTAITFSLTGKTYHGYQFNRSHSIADSLLGKDSYTSNFNFTTGTRSQNVGANKNGGMRYAEELAEKYWRSHSNTTTTISYQTTPLYNENETIPRGSIVDLKSSDGIIDIEIVVINSAEGLDIDYNSNDTSTATSKAPMQSSSEPTTSVEPTPAPEQPAVPDTNYTTSGNWTIAAPGMVFISNTNRYYSSVTNPQNYVYTTQDNADASGAVRAPRGNQYARP